MNPEILKGENKKSIVFVAESFGAPSPVCKQIRRRIEGCLPHLVNQDRMANVISRLLQAGKSWEEIIGIMAGDVRRAYKGQKIKLLKKQK